MPFGVVAASGQSKQNPTGTKQPYQPTPSTHPLLGTPRLQPHLWLLGTPRLQPRVSLQPHKRKGLQPLGYRTPEPSPPSTLSPHPLTTYHWPLTTRLLPRRCAFHRRQHLSRRPLVRRIPRGHLAVLADQPRRHPVRQRPLAARRYPNVEELQHCDQFIRRGHSKLPVVELRSHARVRLAIALQHRRRVVLGVEADAQ